MKKGELVAILNQDIESEHGAIIQYLIHAYSMGEGEIACEIEAIAREEMRHLDWLAEAVVDLGGVPSIKRGKMRMSGKQVTDWMKNNVLLEKDAIGPYTEQIKLIDKPKDIKRLLERILSDEEAHHHKFQKLVDKVKREGMKDLRGTKQDKVSQVLNWGIEHEYTVVLQYLLHSYMTKNGDVKREMEDQAINEMQHLGWLAEELVSGGGNPRIEHTKVDQSKKTTDMLKADIAIEKKVTAAYDRAAKQMKDPDLKKLLIRIRDHEIYHTDVFTDLLKAEKSK